MLCFKTLDFRINHSDLSSPPNDADQRRKDWDSIQGLRQQEE